MPVFKDLTYQTFGRLFVICRGGQDARGRGLWWCHCECGDFTEVTGHALTSGNTSSCGCGMHQGKHLDAQNKASPYESWKRMRQRCYNPNFKPAYHRYGGRGIKVCSEWQEYTTFRDWALAHGWEKGLHLDRIDVDGDYTPENCRWVTKEYNTWRRWHAD